MSTAQTMEAKPRATTDAGSYHEGPVARAIEKRTARIPSDLFLWSAGASIATSMVLHMVGRRDDARFVGQWAPTILTLGVYNKIVKLFGSD